MRRINSPIWSTWASAGPFIGDAGAPHGRVTVEPAWYLQASGPVVGTYGKGPVRSFQDEAGSQIELEVPNVRSISIERSIDADAGSCTITLTNQIHVANLSNEDVRMLGKPGYYSFGYGATSEAQARWGQEQNAWRNLLTPGAMLRTFQGFGGKSKTIAQALADEDIVLTGIWIIDEVLISASGTMTLRCRDTAKLLMEQITFPPLVPESLYPLRYCRWRYDEFYIPGTPSAQGAVNDQPSQYGNCTNLGSYNSGNELWYSGGWVHGHHPSHAFDGDASSYYYSVGNGSPDLPFAVEWIEICTGGTDVNAVYIHPWGGNYICYISVWENGGWVDESGGETIPYDAGEIGRYTGANTANIPWVLQVGIPWEEGIEHVLNRTYQADKIRLSFTNLAYSPDGPYHYRAGVREARARIRYNVEGQPPQQGTVRNEGDYTDYATPVKDLLLWAGFWLRDAYDSDGKPAVYGNIESTGIYSDECLNDDVLDKRPVIDVLKTLKDIVGYVLFIDDEGAVHFESPNTWGPGNFLEFGEHTGFIPEIDEQKILTDYTVSYKDSAVVSEIIVSSERPIDEDFTSTITTRFTPSSASLLRGIVKPFAWVNFLFQNPDEQRILAELVALNIFFQLRQGSVTCVANPLIGINDQVRIYDRVSSEHFIHYVRGVSTEMDLISGAYTMNLTTHWLGDGDDWVVRDGVGGGGSGEYFILSPRMQEFLRQSNSRAVAVARPNNPGGSTIA